MTLEEACKLKKNQIVYTIENYNCQAVLSKFKVHEVKMIERRVFSCDSNGYEFSIPICDVIAERDYAEKAFKVAIGRRIKEVREATENKILHYQNRIELIKSTEIEEIDVLNDCLKNI